MNAIANAEIITVGTELLLGEIVDTNSARVAADLAEAGVDVFWAVRVGDNLARIAAALRLALQRSDLIVLAGGLGPTDDDLTRDAVASVVGEEQHVDPAIEAWLRDRFAAGGRPMPASNLRQARVIPSAAVLPNPVGTAPGWLVRGTWGGAARYIVTLPGPPRELDRMWRQEAMPRLPLPTSRFFVHTFKTIGVGESAVAERLGALTDQANPSVATYAKADGVHVRVAAKAQDAHHAAALARPTLSKVAGLLDGSVWGHDADELPRLVLAALRARRQRVAIAEGSSGGVLTGYLVGADEGVDPLARPTSLAGATHAPTRAVGAIGGSVIACDSETMRALGVDNSLLDRLPHGVVEVAVALAIAVRAFFKVDLGVANLGPCVPVLAAYDDANSDERSAPRSAGTANGGSSPPGRAPTSAGARGAGPAGEERPLTRVVIAIASGTGTSVRTVDLPPLGGPWQRERTAFTSLHLLRSALR